MQQSSEAGTASELMDALAMLSDTNSSDVPRCSRTLAAAIKRSVIDRSKRLGTDIRHAIRLVRLASLCAPEGAGYAHFLYSSMDAFNPRAFAAAIRTIHARTHLPANAVQVQSQGVVLLEPGASAEAGRLEFELGYVQMPRLAGILDVLHNTLGYETVARLVQPITSKAGGEPVPLPFDRVAQDLRNSFNAWLATALTNKAADQKRKAILEFLNQQGVIATGRPERIDDDLICDFWLGRAKHWRTRIELAGEHGQREEELARDEGLRMFRSAAIALVRYRLALRDALAEQTIANAISFDFDDRNKRDDSSNEAENNGDLDPGEANSAAIDALLAGSLTMGTKPVWISPIGPLSQPPADRIKWLKGTQLQLLRNYLGSAAAEDEAELEEAEVEPEPAGDEGNGAARGGLAGHEPFDLALLRTLLRVDVFGALQQTIVQRMRRKRSDSALALADTMKDFAEPSYSPAIDDYAELAGDIRLACWAALDILGHAGKPRAALLVTHLAGDAVLRSLVGSGIETGKAVAPADDDALQRISRCLQSSFSGQELEAGSPVNDLVKAARRSRRGVGREGFRKQDENNSENLAALDASVPWAIALCVSLDELSKALGSLNLESSFERDRGLFTDGLKIIYDRPQLAGGS